MCRWPQTQGCGCSESSRACEVRWQTLSKRQWQGRRQRWTFSCQASPTSSQPRQCGGATGCCLTQLPGNETTSGFETFSPGWPPSLLAQASRFRGTLPLVRLLCKDHTDFHVSRPLPEARQARHWRLKATSWHFSWLTWRSPLLNRCSGWQPIWG